MTELTREERVQSLYDLKIGQVLNQSDIESIKMLARMVLAAMDSEPVVQPVMFIDGDISSDDADKLAKIIREFNEEDERPLAKMARIIRENPHPTNECDMPKAQPAPVVPDRMTAIVKDEAEYVEGWNACRAAMLQELQKSAGASNNCRSNEKVQVLHTIKAPPAMGSLSKTGEVLHTNSPVIPEGYVMVPKEPTEAMINAWLSEVANWRGHVAGYKAMLAAGPQEVK
ncbi:hypothetical protein [Klebsiella michiganensis]|uniref:hypothetical protein n=1 Tax=Klebsiella michiganensis TaxID=1134687 RepID=UPI001CCA9EFE|nr:hypothetical protein [Klebsiella michiganensis]